VPGSAESEGITMDVSTIVSLISSLDFTIIACIYMARWVYKKMDRYRADIKELQEDHKSEIIKVTEALNNNTKALIELSAYIKRSDTK
jgi:predicted DNA-binding ArsR family transcriptional regulator